MTKIITQFLLNQVYLLFHILEALPVGQLSPIENFNVDYQARNADNSPRTPGTYQRHDENNNPVGVGTYQRHDENNNPSNISIAR